MSGFSMGRAEFFGTSAADAPLVAQAQESAARRPHVCFVAPMVWPILAADPNVPVVGGAEVQQAFIARGLARAGYRVSMICLDYGQPEYERIDGIAMHKSFRLEDGIRGLRFIPRLASWWKAMRAVDADIYYQRSSTMLTGIVDAFCRKYERRSIYAAASDMDFRPGQEPMEHNRDRWIYHRGLRRVDRIVVQNAAQQRDCRDTYGRDSELIPSCYELPPGTVPGAGGSTVLWVANMRAGKRPQLLLDIAALLPHRQFVMVGGDGSGNADDARRLEEIRAKAQKLPNVRMTGFMPMAAAEAFFDDARVVVNTSAYEGMPNTFLQAWARGVPTHAFIDVGARVGSEPLYRVAATVEESAAEIERHFTDSEYYATQSRHSLDYFEQTHSLAHVVQLYGGLLDTLHPGRRG
jgi:glycosyltransferase involved in cell wall biosynthesis